MNIPYALRSKFTAPCQEGIVANQEALNAGQMIQIVLEAKGYPGKIKIAIGAGKMNEFEADWSSSNSTRFPARIKAAATTLRDCGYTGSFVISHAEGVLSIARQLNAVQSA